MRHRQRQYGFTIVELLIVIVVVAILAAVTIVGYSGVRGDAEQTARVAELSQLQKQIQLDALNIDGRPINIDAPIVYKTDPEGDSPLSKPLVNAQEITLYMVFDTDGVLGTDYTSLVYFLPHTTANNSFTLRTNTGSQMGSRVDTSQSNNRTASSPQAIRGTTGRHVGWMTTKAGNFYINYDSHAPRTGSLDAHSGWNFDSLRMNSTRGVVAALGFSEFHDEKTRRQVLRWLDREFSIDYYD